MDEEPVNENAKAKKPLSDGFIPTLKGKKVVIRLVSGGRRLSLNPLMERPKCKSRSTRPQMLGY
jgi:hypothetical protein